MKKSIILSVFLCIVTTLQANDISVYDLRCNGLESPVGIDTSVNFGWKINSHDNNFIQKTYSIELSTEPEFKNNIIWKSGKIISRNSTSVRCPAGLSDASTYFWRVRIWGDDGSASPWSQTAKFATGLKRRESWCGAKWIAMEADGEKIVPAIHAPETWHKLGDKEVGKYPMPLFRKKFKAGKGIRSATAYICGLGHFDLFLNGTKVGSDFMDPGWTMYGREALYVCLDMTELIEPGDNEIRVALGNGMYNIPRERYFKFTGSYGAPKMTCLVKLEYTDGSTDNIVSDTSWSVTPSPVTFSSIFGGEDYDARIASRIEAGSDGIWHDAVETTGVPHLKAQSGTAMRIKAHYAPQRVLKSPGGNDIYDFGRNMAGIVGIKVKGKAGQRLVLRPAELLDENGNITQQASGTPYYFSYTVGSDSTEYWHPNFTYYGFRYVEVVPDTCTGAPQLLEITALNTASEAPLTGHFRCSNDLFNSIYTLIDRAMESNTASVLTDCPHREKLGWLEQCHLMQNSLCSRRDMRHIYEKLMADMAASQLENGAIPTIAPEYVRFEGGFEDSPEWGSAFILCPLGLWKWYGDIDILEKYYPDMKRYMGYLASRAENHIITYGLGDWYDIGPAEPSYAQLTSPGVTATALYYQNACAMAEIAQLLGIDADCEMFRNLATDIRKSYNSRFFNEDKAFYDHNSQTANAISLHLGLADDRHRDKIVRSLANDISSKGLTAGDIGYRYVLKALEDNGLSELIYDMNSRFDTPGYGWQLAHGATTLTESWQAYGFVSNNHMMLGHLMEWLFSGLGGLSTDSICGPSHIIIKPQPAGDINYAETSIGTPYGEASCLWKMDGRRMIMNIHIPANTSASVFFPKHTGGQINNYGMPFTSDSNVNIGSGNYLFEYYIL